MIKDVFDFKLATFHTLQEIDQEELKLADMVIVDEHVPAGIYHSQKLRWRGYVGDISDPVEMIRSKKERKAVLQNKAEFEAEGYTFSTKPFTEDLYQQFIKLYEETVREKKRPTIPDIHEQIYHKVLLHIPMYFVGMFQGETLVSSLAFSVRQNMAWVSLGAKRKFPNKRGGVGGVLELELIQFCLDHNIPYISHGSANNPAGIYDSAGVFEFKARYGFSAYPDQIWQTTFILNEKIAISDLVFVTAVEDQISQLVLTNSTEDMQSKYQTLKVPRVVQRSLSAEIEKHRAYFHL